MRLRFGWVLVSVLAAGVAAAHRIGDIGANLGRALERSIELENETFTKYDSNVTNVMDVAFDPQGMQGLYNITKFFMDLVQSPDTVLPEDIDISDPSKIDIQQVVDKLPSLIRQYAGILALTVVAVVFAVFMPLVGLFFCCCRCCGRCGARSRPFDKKHDTCRKIVLGMLLIAVATLLLFGVVCAFASNQHMEDGCQNLAGELREGVVDVRAYLDDTEKHVETLFVVNFDELEIGLVKLLELSSVIITDELSEAAKAVSFKYLVEFVNGLDDMSTKLTYMKKSTNELRVNASVLSDGLRRAKNDLIHSLNSCTLSKDSNQQCSQVKEKINRMETTIDFDKYLDRYFPKLPDVTHEITRLQNIIDEGKLQRMMQQANNSFGSIEKNIRDNIDNIIPEIKKAIHEAGGALLDTYTTLKKSFVSFSKTLGRSDNKTLKESDDYIDVADKYIKEYSKYRYYSGIAESSVLLAIVTCVTLGLMCGVCGKRPDGYDDDCCNKGSGSRFLMIAVCIMFLFAAVLMIATLAYFLTGFLTQRLVCDTMRNPDSKLFSLVDEIVANQTKQNMYSKLSTTIKKCHVNSTAYVALNLEKAMHVNDFAELLDKYHVSDRIREFKDKIHFNNSINIISKDMKNELETLKKSGIAEVNFDRFTRVLEHNITSIDLNEMVESLRQLESMASNKDLKESIQLNARYLEMYQKNLVQPMVETAHTLTAVAVEIQQALRLNHSDSNFNDTLDIVEKEIKDAQDYINKNGSVVIEQIANEFATKFQEKLQKYIFHVGNETVHHVGNCRPLSKVYNMTLIATCDKIFYPWNGFWVCVGWCSVLFVPAIVLCVKLASLYQSSDSYPGPMVEAEYLYDAYADRDNIPLNSRQKKHKKKRKKRGPQPDMYDTRVGYPPEAGDVRPAAPRERDAPGGSSHPDTRYADMAPKHWDDYPNGGPPHYQQAPMATEYERPPPYYYPGPG